MIVTYDQARGPVLEFFGTQQSYVVVPPSTEFDMNVYSVMFWMNPYDIGRKQAVFAHGESFATDEGVSNDNIDKSQVRNQSEDM